MLPVVGLAVGAEDWVEGAAVAGSLGLARFALRRLTSSRSSLTSRSRMASAAASFRSRAMRASMAAWSLPADDDDPPDSLPHAVSVSVATTRQTSTPSDAGRRAPASEMILVLTVGDRIGTSPVYGAVVRYVCRPQSVFGGVSAWLREVRYGLGISG